MAGAKAKVLERKAKVPPKRKAARRLQFFPKKLLKASLIRSGKFWSIHLHPNQAYLGRCFVYLSRPCESPLELTRPEMQELVSITKNLSNAMKKAFRCDLINYSISGNGIRQLHVHLVPRYKRGRTLFGVKFKDARWGHNYSSPEEVVLPSDVFGKIKGLISANYSQK